MIRLIALACLLATSLTVNAATLTVYFEGMFNSTNDLFNVGDTFEGSFTYELTATQTPQSDNTLNVQAAAIWPTLAGTGWELHVDSSTALGDFSVLGTHGTVAHGNDTAAFGDRWITTLYQAGTNPLPGGNTLNLFQLDFQDSNASGADMLAGDALTELPDLALAATKNSRFFVATDAGGCTQCFGTITYLGTSVVPLPAAAWLFISALGGLVVAKRKQLKA